MFGRSIVLICCLSLQPEKANQAPVDAPQPASNGTIMGKAIFEGDPRAYDPAPIMAGKDPICAALPRPLFMENVILNKQSHPVTVRHVVVHISGGLPLTNFVAPRRPINFDVRGCRFDPHVLAFRAGQLLVVQNHDRTVHSPHFLSKANEYNLTLPPRAPPKDLPFAVEPVFRVKCDVHPWEIAWAAVFDHPFFAVTGDDGLFKIEDVPPGKYTLEAWHEKFGTLRQDVELGAGESKSVDFTFAPKLDEK